MEYFASISETSFGLALGREKGRMKVSEHLSLGVGSLEDLPGSVVLV